MYPGYGRANPGPSNPVLLPDSRIPKLRQGSPIMMVPYGYNPAATNAPVPAVRTTQQRYYDANPAQAAQVQNPYTGQVSGYPRPSSPVPASFNQVYYQPAIQNKQAWPVKAAPNHNYIQAEGVINNTDGDNNYYDDDDDDDDDDDGTEFRAVGFQDSLTQYPFYERGAYAMFYSREQCIAECHQQPVNILAVGWEGTVEAEYVGRIIAIGTIGQSCRTIAQ
ncbi:hypothetical protein LSH36_930g00031 [Paralvinella palmiformis]|uniref:Uncharacterized protein n=1 Tax=Paralvinella palmiformis TaxID=53620 RepID=A0AAD9IY32_9ANNE|nr:hypothetical protein LSH36_930g00031 [Paralvinella palmiformis]